MQGGQKRPLTHLEKGKLSTVVIGMCWAFNSYLQAKRRRCAVFSFTQAGIMIGRVPFCYLRNDRVMFAFAEYLKGMLWKFLTLALVNCCSGQKDTDDA